MTDIPVSTLAAILVLLILLSAFFSAAETAMMRLNQYRLRHLVQARHRGAVYASRLLERPDRLIGFILLGSNFVNVSLVPPFAASVQLTVAGHSSFWLAS